MMLLYVYGERGSEWSFTIAGECVNIRMYINDCVVMSVCINNCRLYNKRLCINIIFCMNVNYKDERSASVSVANFFVCD